MSDEKIPFKPAVRDASVIAFGDFGTQGRQIADGQTVTGTQLNELDERRKRREKIANSTKIGINAHGEYTK
jgi:hypothetical protein